MSQANPVPTAAPVAQQPNKERVLFVDDEPQVLEAIQRTLRNRVNLHTAKSAEEGIRLLTEAGPFALVISDMRMPITNGAQFLTKVRAQSVDTVRMILSGQADLASTIAAVNDGQIYRFLCKPIPTEKLLAAVDDGIAQYRLITAEKVLLEQTLSGSIKMLIEILGMVSPSASSRASRLQRAVLDLVATLALKPRWEWGLAAYVSQIGCVTLPKEILAKVEARQPLNGDERRLYESHPDIAKQLLVSIPRLEDVAAMVSVQYAPMTFADKPANVSEWDTRSMGQVLLRTAFEHDQVLSKGGNTQTALDALKKMRVPQVILDALSATPVAEPVVTVRQVCVSDLVPGMVLEQDLVSVKGIRLVPAGMEVTHSLIVKLESIASGVGVAEPFRVRG